MLSVNDILRENFEQYKSNHFVSYYDEYVVEKLIDCRTDKMGRRILVCDACQYEEITYCSCRNRHCPQCQTFTKEKWVDERKQDLINAQYFHVVFTVPDQLKMLIEANETLLYNLMYKCVSQTILELTKDPKYLGADTGVMLILHTWNQKLEYHPHLHGLIPGGGLKEGKWISTKEDYFIPVKVLAKLFRGKFLFYLEELHKQGKLQFTKNLNYLKSYSKFYDFKVAMMNKNWYVYVKETYTSPNEVISYLGRYTHKVGITNDRIKKVSDGKVTFSYIDNKDRDKGKGKKKLITLDINEFIRRFLLHILPKGFVKIRYYGLLSNRNKKTFISICQVLTKYIKRPLKTAKELLEKMTKGNIFICPICKSKSFHLLKIEDSTVLNE